jgi:hypothetical protein
MRIRFSSDIARNSPPPPSRIRGCAHPWADLHRRSAQKEYDGIEYGGLPVSSAASDAATAVTNELHYPRWLFAAQHPACGGRDLPSPAARRHLRSVRRCQVFLAFRRHSHVFLDGPAKNRPRLVESSQVTGSPHSQHVLDRTAGALRHSDDLLRDGAASQRLWVSAAPRLRCRADRDGQRPPFRSSALTVCASSAGWSR